MKIAIIGTRGIPNYYGGFEQFAEYLSLGLIQFGFDVTVYNSHSHPYRENNWKGVKIVHCYDPENRLGTIGQFVYDLNCIIDCRKRNFDIILQLGYTSSSVWFSFWPKSKSVITTNMDGLEWKRTKYSRRVQQFLKFAEELAVKHSDHLISDSIGIQQYLNGKYGVESTYIPYGAHLFNTPDKNVIDHFNLIPYQYDLLIARLEPENSIEIILDGVAQSKSQGTFLVIGNHETRYGEYLKEKYAATTNIRFIGGVYDIDKLNNIRYFSRLYFHGHTVGGTNPSLLEAMASNAFICAHDNVFNKSILGEDASYFNNSYDVAHEIEKFDKHNPGSQEKLKRNVEKISKTYAWPLIVQQYIEHFNLIKRTN